MSLVELGWRRFNFFDKELVTDPQNSEQAFLGLQELESVCSVAGNGLVLFGEGSGGVCQMNRALAVDFWKAYKVSLAAMALVPAHNVLVTVGEDEDGVNTLLKVWRLDRMEKGSPFCSRVSRVSQHLGNRPAKGTAVAAHSSLGYAAVGFEDSSVLLFKGDVSKERQSHKPTSVRDGASLASDGPVTGLAFHMRPDSRLVLFVATTRAIFSYVIKDKDVEKKNVHDAKGCDRNCWALGDSMLDYQFIVARRDMVYFYNPEQCAVPEDATNGKCHGLERDKDKIVARVFGSYLCLVTKDAGVIESGGDSKMHMVTVYDIPGQYIAYSAPVPEVLDVFFEFNNLFVVCKNGKLFRLREKDIQTKLDVLFKKNLYDVAIGLAKRHYCDETYLMEIFKKNGDYFYSKSDFENAVKQYILTIGKLEPSYVIRKFLDASRIAQLTNYLEALHGAGLATADHTTILLNCYTKLQATDKIERFIADAGNRLTFDVDTAIKVLRSADYTKEALKLAERHNKDDIYLRILLENTHDYQAAVKRIAKLPFELAEKHLKNYGKVLLANAPNETTALLKTLCSGFDGQRAAADQFIHVFMDDPEKLREFLEHIAKEVGEESSSMTFYNTLLELYLRERAEKEKNGKKDAELDRRIIALIKNNASPYQNEKDLDQALVLCQMYDFGPGMLYILEKAKMHQNILQYHMTRKNFTEVVRTCQQFGEKDMWVEALWFVSRLDDVPVDVMSDLLRHINEENILPPLMVLEILSHSQTVTLGVVKDYLMTWLKTENDQINKDERLIKEYQEEIKKVEEKIDDLHYNPQVFQVSKCSACDTPLEVPTVHFLCKHSFHQHCFESYSENDQECPACLPENKKLRALLSARQDSNVKDTYHQFKSDLKDAKDTIAVVAEYFGKGIYQQTGDASVAAATSKSKPADRKPKSTNPFDDDA